MDGNDFFLVVQQGWYAPQYFFDAAKIIVAKFKDMRKVLKVWQSNASNLKKTIANVKLTLAFMLFIEEFRDLTVVEWNFKLLEQKLTSLLRQQHMYWKQRGLVKWIMLGDASIKFFHANATIKYRRNLITSLEDSSSTFVTTHEEKAKQIWKSFKDQLGVSSFIGISFDLTILVQNDHDLSYLVAPFEKEEINQVIRLLPSDKAPGPDGFKTGFVKKVFANYFPRFVQSLQCFLFGGKYVCRAYMDRI